MITTTFCFCHRFQERFSYDSTVHTKCAYKEQLYYQPHHISRPEKLNWFWLPFYIFLYFFQPHYYTQPHTVSWIQSATITCTSLLCYYDTLHRAFRWMDGWWKGFSRFSLRKNVPVIHSPLSFAHPLRRHVISSSFPFSLFCFLSTKGIFLVFSISQRKREFVCVCSTLHRTMKLCSRQIQYIEV